MPANVLIAVSQYFGANAMPVSSVFSRFFRFYTGYFRLSRIDFGRRKAQS
jgi:hypothetical protein